jgi:diguanylate cyclase (GGDEF)-like protein
MVLHTARRVGYQHPGGTIEPHVSRASGEEVASRARAAGDRAHIAAQRDETARARDLTALARDRVAEARDHIAEARDLAAEARVIDAAGGRPPEQALADALATVRLLRASGARLRRQAAADRASSAADRERAASDRRQAAIDRRYAGVDDLTGVLRRGTGEVVLQHELDRAQRTGRPLVLAMIDVDGLKTVNDRKGHTAGDALLRGVADAVTSSLRSYDITIRWGGDEFVCVLSDMSLADAERRFEDVKAALRAVQPEASVSAGLAERHGEERLADLIARADAALYLVKEAAPRAADGPTAIV